MATTNQSVEKTPASAGVSNVVAKATFSAEGDLSNWTAFTGDVVLQGQGPVDAATVAIERSTIDPSGGVNNAVEVVEDTGAGGAGVVAKASGIGTAWYRAKNKATFGPASTVTARSLLRLEAAINGLQPAANGFFAGTAPQPLVHASVGSTALKMNLTATTAGVAGNSIATTETLTNGSFANTTLTGGADEDSAEGTLTFTALPTADMTVTLGDLTYTFVDALDVDDYEVLIGGDVEETRDNLLDAINGEGAMSTGVITANTNPAAGASVRVGQQLYTFAAAITATSAPGTVKTAASASLALDNLIAAINSAAGAGTTYAVNTPPNADVSAAAGTGDTVDLTSRYSGVDANDIRLQGTAADVKATGTLTFTPGTVTTQTIKLGTTYYIYAADPTTDALADGSVGHPWQVDVGSTVTISLANLAAAINASGVRGVTYSYALSPANANAVAESTASNATTVSVQARAAGTGGNSISTTVPSGAGFAWGSTVLAGGATSLTVGALTLAGGTGAGVTYSPSVEANPLADAAGVSTDALTATALAAGVDGNDIATTDTLTDEFAVGTLTFTPGTVTTQTIKLGTVYYIFAADPTTDALADGTVTHPWQVDVGGDDTTSLANLASAFNADGVAGTTYSTALTANPSAESTASDATTIDVQALLAGAAGNAISTTVPSGAGFAWGATTLLGGGGSWTAATLLGGADAVAATGVLTMTDVPVTTETVTIGAVVYTFKTTPTVANDVAIAGLSLDVVLSGTQAVNV